MTMRNHIGRGAPPLRAAGSGNPGPATKHRWRYLGAGGAAALALGALGSASLVTAAGATGGPPQISQIAGSGGSLVVSPGNPQPASSAALSTSYVAVDSANGDQVVASAATNDVYLIVGGASETGTDFGLGGGTLVQGDAYQIAGNGTAELIGNPGHAVDGGSSSAVATSNPVVATSVAFDSAGNVLLAGAGEQRNDTTASAVQVVARTTGTFYGVSMTAGDLYTIADVGLLGAPSSAIGMGSVIVGGYGVTTDGTGNVFVGASYGLDFLNYSGSTESLYGKSEANHTSTTVAGSAVGSATCSSGAQSFPASSGGSAVYYNDTASVVDGSDNVYLTDNEGGPSYGCVWVLPAQSGTVDNQSVTAGNVYKVAGNGGTTATPSGSAGVDANVGTTAALTLDDAGNLVLAEEGGTGTGVSPGVQVLAMSTGTYWDVKMTAGDIYTVAGGAGATSTTVPGNAAGFELQGPSSIAADGAGNLFLTDQGANGTDAATGNLYEITEGPTLTLTWKTPRGIDYGTALSSTQLNAAVTLDKHPVAGTYTYTPAAGTVLEGGLDTLSVVFSPDDTNQTVSGSVVIDVKAVKPVLSWPAPSSISYPTALSGTQLDATATYQGNPVAGTFSYSDPSGTVLNVGTAKMVATFTPSDTADFISGGTAKASLVVTQEGTSTAASFSPTVTYGSETSETFSVTVTPSASNAFQPVGTAEVYAGTSLLCKATISGGTGSCAPASGNKLRDGSYSITVKFSDGTKGDFGPSESSASTLTVSS